MTARRRGEKSRQRPGVTLVEVVIGCALLAAMLVPILGTFSTAVRQTQGVRSRLVACCIGDWALAQAQAFVAAGMASPEDHLVLTPDVSARFAQTAEQLRDLEVQRSLSPIGEDGTLYAITIWVRWQDPDLASPREVVLEALERSEI